MADKASKTTAHAWVVEVLGDGIGVRHRRYIVGATDRETALRIVREQLGPDVTINSTSEVKETAFGVVNVMPGEITLL